MTIVRRSIVWVFLASLPVAHLAAEQEPMPPAESIESIAIAPAVPPPPARSNDLGPMGGGFGMGGSGMGGMGGPGMGGGMPGYGAAWYPSRPVSGSMADLGLVRQNLSLGTPLWRNDGSRIMVTASVRNSLFFTDAILSDSRRPFPNELWNVSLGLNSIHRLDNGWTAGFGVNVGSASDKPFHSIEEMTFGFMGFLRVPTRNDRDAWLLSLIYSPVSNFNFPIPGVAYSWNPSDEWHVNIGLPFSVTWRPNDDWVVNLSYVPVTNVNARATYRVQEGLFVYGGFEWLYEAYFLADREVRNDRFIGFEKRLIGGVRWDVWSKATLDVNAGYAFDREYGTGQNQLGNLSDRIDIAPGAFLGTNLRIRY
jgi:hypothetical protein